MKFLVETFVLANSKEIALQLLQKHTQETYKLLRKQGYEHVELITSEDADGDFAVSFEADFSSPEDTYARLRQVAEQLNLVPGNAYYENDKTRDTIIIINETTAFNLQKGIKAAEGQKAKLEAKLRQLEQDIPNAYKALKEMLDADETTAQPESKPELHDPDDTQIIYHYTP